MKTNYGKLFAAVAIFAMLVCAFAIAMPSVDATDEEGGAETTPAQTSLPPAEDGVITLTGDVVLSQDMTITDRIEVGNNTLTIKGDLVVNYTFTEKLQHVFTIGATGSIIIDGGSLTVDANNGSNFKPVEGEGNIVFYKDSKTEYPADGNVIVKSGFLTVTEGKDVNGQMASGNIMFVIEAGTVEFKGNGIGAAYFVQNGGSVNFDSNNGRLQPYYDLNAGTLTVAGNNGKNAIFTPYAMDIAAGATLNVNGPMDMYNGDTNTVPTNVSSELDMKTVENLGTINVGANGSISIPAGSSLTGTGKVINANNDDPVEQTISNKGQIADAINNDMVGSIVYTGNEPLDVITGLDKPLTVGNITYIATNTTLAEGGSITVTSGFSDLSTDLTVNGVTLKGATGEITGFSADAVKFYYGSAGISFENGNGTIAITADGKISGTVDAGATVTIINNNIASGNVTVDAVGDIKLGKDSNMVIQAGVIFNAGSYIKSDSTSTDSTITVRGTFAYNTIPSNVTIKNDGGVVRIQDGQGLENQISSSQSINGYQYLTSDTTILSGVTLTIPRNSTLDLNGHDLIIYGTLVIEGKGVVTSGAKIGVSYGDIIIMNGGGIQNDGIIGDSMMITIANGERYDKDTDTYGQYIQMQGVQGVSMIIDRGVENTQRVYNMMVSGDVSRITGVNNHDLTLHGVQINADMSIGKDVDLIIDGKVTVAKGVTFTHNGASMTIGNDSGDGFYLSNGASAVINAHTVGKISVETGQVGNGDAITTPVVAYVDFQDFTTGNGYITGITVSAGRVTLPNDDGTSSVYQRMYVSGTADVNPLVQNGTAASREPTATLTTYGVVFIDGTLTIPEEVTAFNLNGGYIDVSTSGTVVVAENDLIDLFSGAMYSVETTTDNVTTETFYYTNFASAMENIANAVEGTIYVNGNFTITGNYTVGDNQEITLDGGAFTYSDTDSRIVVGENGAITVTEDGSISDGVFYTILGSVEALAGTGYTPEAIYPGSTDHYIYSVISVDEETDDTVYSGFKYAMDNAAAGQTITVVGDATYKGNLVVPAQITVTVEDTIKLTVTGNVTVEADGKLVLGNTSQLIVGDEGKTSSVTVAGELDASEAGVINAAAGATAVNVYSTGTLTYVNAINSTNVKVNAAYYNEADEYVYTSVAKAVAYAMENDLPLPIHATGVFSEAGTIESAGVSIVIDPAAVVTLGNITLNDATISGTGDYSATISGLTGAGDAATTSTVSVTKTSATVSSTVTLNAEGVNEYALTINAIDGNTTVAAGTVEFVGDTIYAYKDNALSIATGATLLLGENESFSIWGTKYISNEGTILIEGDVTITDSTILPGQVTVADDGSLTVNATYQSIPVILAVTGNVTVEADGTFIVNGILMFGEPPELLGSTTSGTIDGKVTLNGTAYVFAGASVADTEFVSAQATEINTTAYSINGIDLVTAYTFGNEAIDNMYIDTIVYGLDDLDTWTVDSNDNSVRANIVWHSGETTIGSEYIGEYAEVSTEIAYNSVPITISVGSHISLSIDNVIVDNWTGSYYTLSIGTHTVSVVVDPGYSGNVTITFNGQTVQNGGTITVTSDMLTQMGDIVLSATGQLTQDSTVVIDGGNSGDSSMGLTDYLLIILVVLIVIMAIMVAMRLMRS